MRILWVENNPRFIDAAHSFLHQHNVTVVPSLIEARNHLATAAFDAVLLDYDLDDGKGTELLPALKGLAPRPIIIAASSHSEGNSQLLAAGADLVCSKMDFGRIEVRLKQAA